MILKLRAKKMFLIHILNWSQNLVIIEFFNNNKSGKVIISVDHRKVLKSLEKSLRYIIEWHLKFFFSLSLFRYF